MTTLPRARLASLTHAVQYKDPDRPSIWHTIAAFDCERAAKGYKEDCSHLKNPYRVVEIKD